jgi:hypothetical protein
MPGCTCGNPDLYLTGFEVDPSLKTVMVSYRCTRCGKVTRGKYAETPERLREG